MSPEEASRTDAAPGRPPGPSPTDSGPLPLVTVDLWRVPARRVGGALGRMAIDRVRLRRVDGLTFARLVGTGAPGAFAPWDAEPRRWGLVAVWDSPEAARAFQGSLPPRSWARVADEHFHVELHPLASRGRWSRRDPFGRPAATAGAPTRADTPAQAGPITRTDAPARAVSPGLDGVSVQTGALGLAGTSCPPAVEGAPGRATAPGTPDGHEPVAPGLVAVLTRARLAPRHAVTFWRAAPPVAADLAALARESATGTATATGTAQAGTPVISGTASPPVPPGGRGPGRAGGPTLAIGIGEAPIGLQGTFSVWPSLAAVRAFAYRRPAHAAVVRRTGEVGWYAEELFARFAVLDGHGTVDGRDPLRPDSSWTAR